MKTQIIEQSQSQLGYRGRNNNISTDNEASGKRVKYTDRLLLEAVYNFIRFITDTFIGLL